MPDASTYMYYGMLILLIVLFYVLLIRPQRKRDKADRQMRASLENGDHVCTIGGIIGKVVSVTDETVTIESTGSHTRLKLYKWAIRERLDKEALTAANKTTED